MPSKIINILVSLVFCLITASCATNLYLDSDPSSFDIYDSEEETALGDEESKGVVALLSNKDYSFESGEIRSLHFFDNYSLEAHADRKFLVYGENTKSARYDSESMITLRGIYKLLKADGAFVKIKIIFDSIQIYAFLYDEGGSSLLIVYPDEKTIKGRVLPDGDMDGVPDEFDNCPMAPNEGQLDGDGDLMGDECDEDRDGDGILDDYDNCLWTPNPSQFDTDGDKIGDMCDNAVDHKAPEELPEVNNEDDLDDDIPDEAGDLEDVQDVEDVEDGQDDTPADLDGDGLLNEEDNCPFIANPEQTDTDLDLTGDVCDEDDDGDMLPDQADNCPLTPNAGQADLDNDGLGDVCDEDDDGDGVNDSEDNCPLVKNPSQSDPNGDGIGAACSDNEKKDKK